jgi:hypothetical protein
MTIPNTAVSAADWTSLISDPQVAGQLDHLLRVYRESAPEARDQALIEALSEIKGTGKRVRETPLAPPVALTTAPPPFEPEVEEDLSWNSDRRQHPRMKCFVAVELCVEGSAEPIWGNLSNTSIGGCLIETVVPVPAGAKLELGLWIANGKVWVKGIVLNGIVTRSSPCFGVRVRFADLESSARESLRQFVKFVAHTTKDQQAESGYLARMKRR